VRRQVRRECEPYSTTVGWRPGPLCPSSIESTAVKLKYTYTPTIYIGTCAKCGETHLAEKFGDAIIDGQPVCAACQHRPPATERSEGASTTERSEGVSNADTH